MLHASTLHYPRNSNLLSLSWQSRYKGDLNMKWSLELTSHNLPEMRKGFRQCLLYVVISEVTKIPIAHVRPQNF